MLHFLLRPFSLIYGLATAVRNHLYDSGHRTSFEFDRFVLSIGNLNVGGTGKTPMTEYLIRLLGSEYDLATLSRGYGRKTRGFRLAGTGDTAETIGDEPFQLFRKFPNIKVAVCEERAVGIPFIVAEYPGTDVIILDDAFQHRAVKPDLSILLTTFHKPFFEDYVLPEGRLRESRRGASRAEVVVVTKCPPSITEEDRRRYKSEIGRYAPQAKVFFSHIDYLLPLGRNQQPFEDVVLFSGIAKHRPFREYVQKKFNIIAEHNFPDHHYYSEREIDQLVKSAQENQAVLLTTEKDYRRISDEMRLRIEQKVPLSYIPITTVIENGGKFDALVRNAINNNASDG